MKVSGYVVATRVNIYADQADADVDGLPHPPGERPLASRVISRLVSGRRGGGLEPLLNSWMRRVDAADDRPVYEPP